MRRIKSLSFFLFVPKGLSYKLTVALKPHEILMRGVSAVSVGQLDRSCSAPLLASC